MEVRITLRSITDRSITFSTGNNYHYIGIFPDESKLHEGASLSATRILFSRSALGFKDRPAVGPECKIGTENMGGDYIGKYRRRHFAATS